MKSLTSIDIIKKLQLSPLADEGGLYRQTYVSDIKLSKDQLPGNYPGDRPIGTQIYYLLTDEIDSFSALHRLLGDEVYHFYLGDTLEMLLLYPDGYSKTVLLGSDILSDEVVQFVVPGGVWQGSRLKSGGKFALLGTSMSPGFDGADFELGDRDELEKTYPEQADLIKQLTR